jgi:hypothetical protein
MDIGVKVSRKGFDVFKAVGEELVIDSSRNCLKVDEPKHTTISTDINGTGSVTIPHNLGFIPVVILFALVNGQTYLCPYNDVMTGAMLYLTMDIDATNIIVNASSLGETNKTYDLYYYVSETESAS